LANSRRERGVSLIALMAPVAMMLIALAVIAPSWGYVMQNDREEELIFRGDQIKKAIDAYRRKQGAFPTSLDMLVKNRPRYLRKLYKDPMTPKGDWRLVPPNVACPTPKASATGGLTPMVPGAGMTGTTFGPIAGVTSRSTAKSLRRFNNPDRYNDWCFLFNKDWYIGKQPPMASGGIPGTTPSPTPHH
jgi:type II secretory pathway pseudopilin PulG